VFKGLTDLMRTSWSNYFSSNSKLWYR